MGKGGVRHGKVGASVRIIGESSWMQVGAAGDEVDGRGGGIRTRVGHRLPPTPMTLRLLLAKLVDPYHFQ